MNINQSPEAIIQNLKDAGCDMETITQFMNDYEKGQKEVALKKLTAHRKALLESLHKEQKCIDCLDYLMYQMRRENV